MARTCLGLRISVSPMSAKVLAVAAAPFRAMERVGEYVADCVVPMPESLVEPPAIRDVSANGPQHDACVLPDTELDQTPHSAAVRPRPTPDVTGSAAAPASAAELDGPTKELSQYMSPQSGIKRAIPVGATRSELTQEVLDGQFLETSCASAVRRARSFERRQRKASRSLEALRRQRKLMQVPVANYEVAAAIKVQAWVRGRQARGRSWAIHREGGAEPSASPWVCFVLGFHRLLGCEINKKEPTGSPTAKVRKVDDTPEWLLQAESALKERIAEECEAHAR